MRPNTLDQIVGQEKCIEVLRTLITYAKNENTQLPHILINSPSGTGKTSIAKAISKEIDANFFEINCATVSKPLDLFNIIEDMNDKDILFLDEVHQLSTKISECLYSILEDFCYYERGIKYDINKITIIGASTEIGKLPIPLVSRFNFKASLEPYSEEDLVNVCKLVCESKGFKLNHNTAKIIAKTCRGIPRTMKNRAEWLYAYMSSKKLKSLSKEKVIEIIGLQGCNQDGLEKHDIEYLKLLDKHKNLSLNNISSKLNTNKDNVTSLIEPYLLKLNLIEIAQGSGRKLTKEGKEYLKSILR